MTTGRLFVYGAPVAGAAWAWLHWHQPGHLTGLVLLLLAGLAAWPVLAVVTVFILPALLQEAWPRDWRKWWRKPHWWRWGKAARKRNRKAKRQHVPAWLRRAVLAADGYCCAVCKSPDDLEIDHIVPWSLGGLITLWNLAALCYECNMYKSNYWEYRSGVVVYRPWSGFNDPDIAREILHAELQHRWNPARWWRAAIVLA